MSLQPMVSSTLFSSRLRIFGTDDNEVGTELEGNSIRCYSRPIGYLLEKLGYSSKLHVADQDFYVNNKSLSKFIIRTFEKDETGPHESSAKKVHEIFMERKQSGYNEALDATRLTEVLNRLTGHVHSLAISKKDATYEGDPRAIDDFCYANAFRGFGYVADGTGHNQLKMAEVLRDIFIKFNEQYIRAHAARQLETFEDYRALVEEQLTTLGETIHYEERPVLEADPKKPGMTHMRDGTLKPAFSFAQVAKIGEARRLISAQFSDTMILIKKVDGTFDVSLAECKLDFGIGDSFLPVSRAIKETEVFPGDIVYGFSDGIGEFLTMKECQEIIEANRDRGKLLDELKERIIKKGGEKSGSNKERSANGGKLKFHDPQDPRLHDDISMFSLQVI